MLDPHDLKHDFPEFQAQIDYLKASDANFAKLMEQYEQIDREVHLIEQSVEPVSDVYAEDLKKQRIVLKDQLYQMLKAAKA
jgi:uncharacterized protein